MPETLPAVEVGALLALAANHGVLGLLARQLEIREDLAESTRARLHAMTMRASAVDAAREHALRRLLQRLHEAGVHALLMKGAELAYTHYPRPDLRPRLDTDVIVDEHQRSAAHDVLVADGYEAVGQVDADLVMYQRTYRRAGDAALVDAIDLHWRVANPQAFGDVLAFDELAASSRPVPALGSAARGLGDVHALLLACVHRVAHHADDRALIWLYDIHLLACGLDTHDWTAFWSLARNRRVTVVCAHSLRLAARHFHTALPASVVVAIDAAEASGEAATTRYLGRRMHLIDVLDDLRSMPGWPERARLVRQHALPSPQYMREVYAPGSQRPLAILYVARMLKGAFKWLSRS